MKEIIFLIHNTQTKITQQTINLQKQHFPHPIPILDESNSYPNERTNQFQSMIFFYFQISEVGSLTGIPRGI
jgi:hypothetical protein